MSVPERVGKDIPRTTSHVTRAEISTLKCRADIDILVPEPSCAVGNTPDIDLLWQLSDSGVSSPSDVFSHRRSRQYL